NAKGEADARSAALSAKHDALESQIEAAKASTPALQHHTKDAKEKGEEAPPVVAPAGQTTEDLMDKKQHIAANQKMLASYDRQAQTQKELSENYAQWIQVLTGKQRAAVHHGLVAILEILVIILVALYFTTALEKVMGRMKLDRRQVENLR